MSHSNKKLSTAKIEQVSKNQNQDKKSNGSIFKSIYKIIKYSTLISAAVFIVISGILILGQSGYELQKNQNGLNQHENNPIFNLFQSQQNIQSKIQQLQTIFKSQSSNYVSNKVINLYLDDKNTKYQDLQLFVEYYIQKKYENPIIMPISINLTEEKVSQIVPESITSRIVDKIKQKVNKLMQKSKIIQSLQDTKQLTWPRVYKMLNNGKLIQLIQLLKDSLIKHIYEWSQSHASIYILSLSSKQLKKIQQKKSFNKWLREHDQQSHIIIISSQKLNKFYDDDQQDILKEYNLQFNVQNVFNDESLMKYFNLNNKRVKIIKDKFRSVNQLAGFVKYIEQNNIQLDRQYHHIEKEILQKLCIISNNDNNDNNDNNGEQYFIYQGQQLILKSYSNKSSNKKSKKLSSSRLQRQLQALQNKLQQFKQYIGWNKIKDIFITFIKIQQQNLNKLSLLQLRNIGVEYDFDKHQVKWDEQYGRDVYEIKIGRICGGSHENDENENEGEKNDKNKKKSKQQQQQQNVDQQQDQTNTKSDSTNIAQQQQLQTIPKQFPTQQQSSQTNQPSTQQNQNQTTQSTDTPLQQTQTKQTNSQQSQNEQQKQNTEQIEQVINNVNKVDEVNQ